MTKEEKKEYDRLYRLKHIDIIRARVKKHREDNLQHYLEGAKNNYHNNKQKYRATGRKWYQRNKAHSHAVEINRYHTDPITKIKSAVRVGLNRALKYGNKSKEHPSIIYLGCSIESFKQHIEKQFKEGMTWDNHGDWHLDHKRPLSLLTDTVNIPLLKELCHYTNYQPLWKEENLSKYSK